MRNGQVKTINIFLTLLFDKEKFIFCLKTYLEKLSLCCHIYTAVFSRISLLEMQ